MGNFKQTGLNPGEAIPAPGTAAITNGMHLGANGLWQYPPGYLLASDAGGAGTPLNVTAETSVLNAVLSGGLPAFVSAADKVNLRCWGHAVFGATGTLILNVYAGGTLGSGGTKIAAAVASGSYGAGVARGWWLDLDIHLLSSTTVGVAGIIMPRSATGTGFVGPGANGDILYGGSDQGDAITVSTLPLVLDVRATCSTNTATTQVSCKGAEARYFPKNY